MKISKLFIGEINIIFTVRKGKSIGNSVVKNRQLSIYPSINNINQKCNANGCLQCLQVISSKAMTINNIKIKIPSDLNCKTNNAIYLWKCNVCDKENYYFGRTTQKCHKRTNGHRNCFNNGDVTKSALSMHAMDKHPENMSLENFEIAIVKQVPPRSLKREEFRYIDKYRTKSLGLNRYKTLV